MVSKEEKLKVIKQLYKNDRNYKAKMKKFYTLDDATIDKYYNRTLELFKILKIEDLDQQMEELEIHNKKYNN